MSSTSSPALRKCGNVDYLALDFQPGSPSPHRKVNIGSYFASFKPYASYTLILPPQPSTSSVTSDEKVDYVQVDKEKTQALQSTMQEWTDVRQSTEPAKGVKSWHWSPWKMTTKTISCVQSSVICFLGSLVGVCWRAVDVRTKSHNLDYACSPWRLRSSANMQDIRPLPKLLVQEK